MATGDSSIWFADRTGVVGTLAGTDAFQGDVRACAGVKQLRRAMPQGLKPRFVVVSNVWAKAQTYLEAKASSQRVVEVSSFVTPVRRWRSAGVKQLWRRACPGG